MPYDLHIVRTKDWLDAADIPITKADVDLLISADSELSWSDEYVDMLVEDVVTRFHLISWRGDACFWWYKNEIRFNSRESDKQIKLVKIANLLNAFVVGDDHEHYQLATNANGSFTVKVIDPDA
jgi:hypothetical protein